MKIPSCPRTLAIIITWPLVAASVWHNPCTSPRVISQVSHSTLLSSKDIPLSSPRGGSDAYKDIKLDGSFWSTVSKLVGPKVNSILKNPNRQNPPQKRTNVSRQQRSKIQNNVDRGNTPIIAAILAPSRIIRISLTAWIVAEVLENVGFFEDPSQMTAKARQAWRGMKMEKKIGDYRTALQKWWKQERTSPGGLLNESTWSNPMSLKNKINNLRPKHQFAFGASIGLIGPPVIWKFTPLILKSGVYLFLTSEAVHYVSRRIDQDSNKSIPVVVKELDYALETVRVSVRNCIQSPEIIFDTLEDWFWDFKIDLLSGDITESHSITLGLAVGAAIGFLF